MKKLAILLLLTLAVLTACQNTADESESTQDQTTQSEGESTNDGSTPVVYTTTFSVYDFAKKIAGDEIEVINLFEGVTNAHHWEPSPADIVKLNEADALFINGAGFETWLDTLVTNLRDVELVDTSVGVDLLPTDYEDDHEGHAHLDDHDNDEDPDHVDVSVTEYEMDVEGPETDDNHDDHDDHDHGAYDPHYWVSPEDVKKQAENIYMALIELNPEAEESFKTNYDALKEELDRLDEVYEGGLKNHAGKAIVVPHKAFTYLADEYDLVQIPIEGLLADGDPNPQRMAEIVDLANEQGIQSVFYDPYGSDQTASQIANEIGAELAPLYTLESISEEDEANGEDYFSLMRKNLESIVSSFR